MHDPDLLTMTKAQLRAEVMRLRKAFRKELASTGNHRCWINLLEAVDGKKIKPIDIPMDEFLGNCKRYYKRNQASRSMP